MTKLGMHSDLEFIGLHGIKPGENLDPEIRLYYYSSRYYNPKTSRWISSYPAGFELINPMESPGKPREDFSILESNNWYNYVNSNPIRYTDPTGFGSPTGVVTPQVVDMAAIVSTDTAGGLQMLDQNDSSLSHIPNMAEAGCNFRTNQNFAEMEMGSALTAEQITASYNALVESGAIDADMTVNNPDAVVNDAFDKLGAPDTTATVGWGGDGKKPDYTVMWGENASNTNPIGANHARAGDADGNLLNDPYLPDLDIVEVSTYEVFIHNGDS